MIFAQEFRPTLVKLDHRDLQALLALTRGEVGTGPRVLESLTPTATAGVYRVRPLGYVGRLALPSGAVIDISSRFPFDSVIELLRVAGYLPVDLDLPPAPAGGEPFLLEILARALTREAETIAARGLAKGYVERRFERPPYPGTPDIVRHLRVYGGRPDRLVTKARRLTTEVPVNRAIATALTALLRLPLAREVRHEVLLAATAFSQVSPGGLSPQVIRSIPLDRLTQRYRAALALSALLLEGLALAPAATETAGVSVLFNMAAVWERCVARWVGNVVAPRPVLAPHAFRLGRDGTLPAEADVLVVDEFGAPSLLYDAKYKFADDAPGRSDLYQMVVYCEALGLTEATLVYPFLADPGRNHRIGDVTVRAVGLWGTEQPPRDLANWQPAALALSAGV